MKNNEKDVYLETERLLFRRWEMEDAPFYIQLTQDPKVMKYFPKMLDDLGARGEMFFMDSRIETLGYGFWAIEEKKSGLLIGDIGFQDIAFPDFMVSGLEIGWRIAKKHWRKGYALEGAQGLLKSIKDKNITDKIYSFTVKDNIPSEGLMKKLEMSFLQEFDHPYLEDSHPLSRHVLYEKTL